VAGIVLSSLVLFLGWDPPLNAFLFTAAYVMLATPLNNMALVVFMERIDREPGPDRVLVWSNREFYLGVGRIVVLAGMIVLSSYVVRNSMDLIFLLPFLALYAVTYLGVLGAHGTRSETGSGTG
jgi:hypothetical protein